ncbi:hypothetical protein LTR85_011223 [Meristemomyces frigidus]|nr:hypothetical protein LTR85_011223 [Meristemomyces frigidus]
MEPATDLDPSTARATRALRHITKDNIPVDMAHSPLEEASRTATVGRKRKQPAELWAAYEAPPSYVDKRQKLAENEDYVPLGDDDDDNGDDDSDDDPDEGGVTISRRESKESGEISTSASGSRRSSDQSGSGVGEFPVHQQRKTRSAVANPRVSPIDDEPQPTLAQSRTRRRPSAVTDTLSPKTLDDIEYENLRSVIKGRLEASPTASVESLVRAYSTPGTLMSRRAKDQLHAWELQPGAAVAVGGNLSTAQGIGDAVSGALQVAEAYAQGLLTRPMTWEDIDHDFFPSLAKKAKSLIDSGLKYSVLEALLFFVKQGQFRKQAKKCLDQYARAALPAGVQWPPAGLLGTNLKGDVSTSKPALASKGLLGKRTAAKAAEQATKNSLVDTSAKMEKPKGNGPRTIGQLEALYAHPANFSRKMQVSDLEGGKFQRYITNVRSGIHDRATVESTMLKIAKKCKVKKWQTQALRQLNEFANKHHLGSPGEGSIEGARSATNAGTAREYTQLHVGNIAPDTTAEQLKLFFKGHFILSAMVRIPDGAKRATGYGLVSFATSAGAKRAIQQLDGKTFAGLKVSLQLAEEGGEAAAVPEPQSKVTMVGNIQGSVEQPIDLDVEDQDVEGSEMDVSHHESDEEHASVGDAPDAPANDYGELARTAAFAESNGLPPPVANVRLFEIAEEDQRLQFRYFHLSDPAAYVRCLSCGVEGHMEDDCPARNCEHCGALDQHFSAACPTFRKCSRCRKRGHDARTCANRSTEAGAFGDLCDVCGDVGHVEEECSRLWRTYKAAESNVIKVRARDMVTACYNCGSNTHWGDDCPKLPSFMRRRLGPNKTWSAAYANQFLHTETAEDNAYGNGSNGGCGGYSGGGTGGQTYQLAQFDDMRD